MTKRIFVITLFFMTLCAVATIAFPSDAQADTRYVKVDGTGDGSSWVTASGTYTPTTEVGGTGDRYKTFQMKNGVGIYGG